MNRNPGISTRVIAGIALCLALSIFTSCHYFDPLNPFDRGIEYPYIPITWEKYFNSADYDYAIGYSVQQTTDLGYIIAGYTGTYGGSEYLLLIKTDALGNQEWSRLFGGEGQHRAHCVRQTADGGYIVTGRTDPVGGTSGNDVWLIKTNLDGTVVEWSKTFGGSGYDEGWCVRSTTDGGYIIVGTTSSFGAGLQDVYLIKTDVDGTEEWSPTTFGGAYSDRGYSVRQTSDGGYIIAGVTQPDDSGDDDAYLVKTDVNGNFQWSMPYGTPEYPDGGTCAQQAAGGYILVGYTRSFGEGDFDAFMIKTDSSGTTIQWQEFYGGTGPDRAVSVQQTDEGGYNGYIIAGMTKSYGHAEQAWLIKTDAGGDQKWSQTFGGDGDDRALHVESAQGKDHEGFDLFGFIITGYTNSFVGGSKVYLIYYAPPLL